MKKIILVSFIALSLNAFAQTKVKPDPNSMVNAEEQVNGLPGGSSGKAYSVQTTKKSIKAPAIIAPVENISPTNCADSLGSKGSATFTACEAGKKTR